MAAGWGPRVALTSLLTLSWFVSPESQETRGELVTGLVLDAATRRPVAGATVLLTAERNDQSKTPLTTADTEGRFVYRQVVRGAYTIRATKAGYLAGFFGQHSATDLARVLRVPVPASTTVVVPLWKPASVGGTVRDEFGDPVVAADVQLLKRVFVNGSPHVVSVGQSQTNDRGEYRFAFLVSGEYIVAVPATISAVPESTIAHLEALFNVGGAEAARLIARRFEDSGIKRPTAGGDRIGPFYVQGSLWSAKPSGADSGPGGPLAAWAPVFFQAAQSSEEANVLRLQAGEDRIGADMVRRAVRAQAIAGSVVGPDGPLGNVGITLHLFGSRTEAASASTVSDPTGAFALPGVPPGRYVARVLSIPTNIGASPRSSGLNDPFNQGMFGETVVEIADAPVRDIIIPVAAGPQIRGEITGTAGTLSSSQLSGLRVALVPIGRLATRPGPALHCR